MKWYFSLVLSFAFTVISAQVSHKEIGLEYGEYEVGFKHYLTVDSTRTYQREQDWNAKFIPRPIPISIWYPAQKSPDEKMTVLDYMRILKEEEEWEHLPDQFILNWFYYPNTVENQNHLPEETYASADADYINQKFPTLIYAPSFRASSIENFALCEYLASHGYVVFSSPSRGTETKSLEGGLTGMQTQAQDIQYLISQAGKSPFVDFARLATAGFSFGGLSNVLAHAMNRNIKAIVSLDGSIKYQYPAIQKSPYFDPENVDVPFIHFSQKVIPKEVLIADNIDSTLNHQFPFFDDLQFSEAYHFRFNHLTHSYFSTLGVLFQPRDTRQDKSDGEIMNSYRLMCNYTRYFLDAYIKKDAASKKRLSSVAEENGKPKAVITLLDSKEPKTKKYTFQDFNLLAAKEDYDRMNEIYVDIRKKQSDFEIPEGRLNNLGLQLTFNPKTSEKGIKVFKFATELFPTSSNLFDSLAEAYLFIGEKEKAIANFKKAVELDDSNMNSHGRLKELAGDK